MHQIPRRSHSIGGDRRNGIVTSVLEGAGYRYRSGHNLGGQVGEVQPVG